MALSFLLYGNGSAHGDWVGLQSAYPHELHRLLAHLTAVDAVGSTEHNRPLGRAEAISGRDSEPMLYWYQVGDIGVVYAYDGGDVVVLAIGRVSSPAGRNQLVSQARERIEHA